MVPNGHHIQWNAFCVLHKEWQQTNTMPWTTYCALNKKSQQTTTIPSIAYFALNKNTILSNKYLWIEQGMVLICSLAVKNNDRAIHMITAIPASNVDWLIVISQHIAVYIMKNHTDALDSWRFYPVTVPSKGSRRKQSSYLFCAGLYNNSKIRFRKMTAGLW